MAAYKTPNAIMDVGAMKFAEKLVILNDRAVGMLTRIYNMKKACADAKSRPQFLNDKSLDQAVAVIAKKFPAVDVKRGMGAFAVVNEMRADVMKNLSLYYYTFVDLLELKDEVLKLLTNMDRHQCQLNITLNYDLTSGFLNLVTNYVMLMILLSRVEDRKVVLGLFNVAYSLAHNGSEASFPRLGQMIVDYESPLRKLCEDMGPLNRLIHSSLSSLKDIYLRRNISAEQQREGYLISLLANSKQMLFAAQTQTMACEYLSLDIMDRWIIFGMTLCHSTLLHGEQAMWNLYARALQHGMALCLFRDESLLTFPMVLEVLEPVKSYQRRVQELKELQFATLQTCGSLHAHRRQFLRASLKELYLLVKDQPGLLGPKVLFVWMALSMARDEVLWLLRHIDVWPFVNTHKKTREALNAMVVDKHLPELLFYMAELRTLVQRYQHIISGYHIEYVAGYDSPLLAEVVQSMDLCDGQLNENDQLLITSFLESIRNIRADHSNLAGPRLDWFRLQANVSVLKSAFNLQRQTNFAIIVNTTIFHLKMIDAVEEMLRETSELSTYCFYPQLFDAHLRQCLNFPVQSRYVIAYASIAGHFVHSLHDMCPEERDHIVERGLICCNAVLEELNSRASEILLQMCQEELQLAINAGPEGCSRIMSVYYSPPASSGKSQQTQQHDAKMPGHESMRTSRDANGGVTKADKTYFYLVELCHAINAAKQLCISEHVLVPREYLFEKLEKNLLSTITTYARSAGGGVPRRPSEMLSLLQVELLALQNIDTVVNIDITRLFNDALLQHSQGHDSHGGQTLTSIYSDWYLDVLLRGSSSTGQLVYSDHLRCFVSDPPTPQPGLGGDAGSYTDRRELQALAQLIGPYGVKSMTERLIWNVAGLVTEMYKLVREHQEVLHSLRINFDKPERIRELVLLLNQPTGEHTNGKHHHHNQSQAGPVGASIGSPLEKILLRAIAIGKLMQFRNLLSRALHAVLEQHIPFLLRAMHSLIDVCDEIQRVSIDEMTAAAGVESREVDLGLVNAIKSQAQAGGLCDPEDHYNLSCLLMVFIAAALPKLAVAKPSFFRASTASTQNNSLTISMAINALASLFFLHQRGDVRERMREFVGLVSSGLLQIVGTKDAEQMQQHQSVYILLDRIVHHSPYLGYGELESCFPYALIRSSYLNCYRQEGESG